MKTGKRKINTTPGEAYETASRAIGFTKKAKVLIEIHQNTKLKGEQFHVVYNGGNYENTSSSEKLPTIAACKKNIKSHGVLFAGKSNPHKFNEESKEINDVKRGINVNFYKDKTFIRTIIVNY